MSLKPNLKLLDVSNAFNEKEFKINLPLMSDEKLCEIVVSFRYLGIMKDEAILAMKELSDRRENGSDFKYEDKIDDLIKTLPKIDIDLNKTLKSFRKFL